MSQLVKITSWLAMMTFKIQCYWLYLTGCDWPIFACSPRVSCKNQAGRSTSIGLQSARNSIRPDTWLTSLIKQSTTIILNWIVDIDLCLPEVWTRKHDFPFQRFVVEELNLLSCFCSWTSGTFSVCDPGIDGWRGSVNCVIKQILMYRVREVHAKGRINNL